MRVLVTGATGFVGANLVSHLLHDGHEVHILVRTQAKFWRLETIRHALQIHVVDLCDLHAVTENVCQIRPDWIFHLAVYGAYSYQTDLPQMLRTNITGTANLLLACEQVGFEAFVNTGSSSEYGFKPYAPTETELPDPNSFYAVTKASATMLCRYVARRTRRPVKTLRLYSVYGPYEEPTRLMPKLMMYGLRGGYPSLVSPHIARDFVYVDDVIEAYIKAASVATPELDAVYNIGTAIQSRIGDVVQILRQQLEISAEPVWNSMENRLWDTETWVADITKAQRELNWSPQYKLADGLAKMLTWLKQNERLYAQSIS